MLSSAHMVGQAYEHFIHARVRHCLRGVKRRDAELQVRVLVGDSCQNIRYHGLQKTCGVGVITSLFGCSQLLDGS